MIEMIIGAILRLFTLLISPFQIPEQFLMQIDGAVSFIIDVLAGASWLIPMNILVVCLTVIFLVDNYALLVKFIKWLISIIPFV